MADSTLRLTFTELRIRVAEYLGIAFLGADGNEAAQLPTDAHDLDLVGRLVNDGYARFLTDHKKGWRFMTVPLTLVFGTGTNGDNSRYYLPDDFAGVIVAPFTYAANQAGTRIEMVDEETIRELQASSPATGTPTRFAVRAINTDNTATTHRWEALFWPTPSGTQTVTATYKRFPNKMSGASDASVAGFQHDRTVLAAALAQAESDRNDTIGTKEAMYQSALARSTGLDARAGAASLGDFGDRSDSRYDSRRPEQNYGVDTYNGGSIN